ncbi:hypothetical protein AB0P36_22805 [Streptomyces flavidovirens]|uniref:hypothetical protein n=1 Tax=Streptomyces flavidovirens TaxID=67298 RepID=UPI00343B3A50
MPARSVAPEAEADAVESADVSDHPATAKDDLGQPVYHVRTKELAGYLGPDTFTPIEKLERGRG